MPLPDFSLPCRVKYTRRRGSIAIKITREEIRLLAPQGTPARTINNLLTDRADWIRQTIGARLENPLKERAFVTGEQLLYRGQSYPLQIEIGPRQGLLFDSEAFRLWLPSTEVTTEWRRQLIQHWYQQQAERDWPERLHDWSEQTGLRPKHLKIRPYKSRWGACTHDGRLSLNTQLMMAPGEMLDYVIIHELCHLVHLNHSAAFWALVESYCPDWKIKRRWLRENGHRLCQL